MEVFDLSMRGGLDVAFLSGVQFDSRGHVNASVIGDYRKPKVRLPGGAGSAVLIPTARRAIIWRTKHDKRTFTGKVDFITARGNVSDIVTPLCVFTMHEGELILKSVHPTSSIEEVAANTGFPIRYFSIEQTPPPTSEELRALLGELDIDRAVLGQISNDTVVRAPGMKYKHYAPSAEVYIISGSSEAAARYIRRRFGPGDAVLCFAEELPLYDGCNPTAYGSENDVRTLSAGLFAALRDLDRPDIRTIYARCPEGGGVAYAVGNRLKKAAAFRVVDAEHEA